MKSLGKLLLGAAVVAGGLGLGATTAQAAQFEIYARGPAAYVPPCPGPGYVWAAGYESDGYWIPGRWNYVGVQYYGGRHFDRDDYRGFDRNEYRGRDRGWDQGRRWDGDRDRRWDRDRDRGDRGHGDHYRR